MFWLIEPNTADELADVRHLTVHTAGWLLPCPPTGWQVDGLF
ncbi:hypothetical protein [Streptomyces sp. NPDC048192]